MDALKLTVILTILVAVGFLGALIFITQDSINSVKIPDIERGLVTSKAPVSDNQLANYTVNLSDGKTLYIQNNATLYQSIMQNQTYVFTCRIDFNNKIILVDTAELINVTNP